MRLLSAIVAAVAAIAAAAIVISAVGDDAPPAVAERPPARTVLDGARSELRAAAHRDAERSGGDGPATGPDRPAADRPREGETIRLVSSQFGRIVANGEGQAVYLFDREREGRPECYGACARAWPPVYAKGRPVAGPGIRRGLLGTVRRRGGRRQVTYRGQPLYLYVGDRPGVVLCHDVLEFGGRWLVLRRDGAPVP